jgi:hypothetical protein
MTSRQELASPLRRLGPLVMQMPIRLSHEPRVVPVGYRADCRVSRSVSPRARELGRSPPPSAAVQGEIEYYVIVAWRRGFWGRTDRYICAMDPGTALVRDLQQVKSMR